MFRLVTHDSIADRGNGFISIMLPKKDDENPKMSEKNMYICQTTGGVKVALIDLVEKFDISTGMQTIPG